MYENTKKKINHMPDDPAFEDAMDLIRDFCDDIDDQKGCRAYELPVKNQQHFLDSFYWLVNQMVWMAYQNHKGLIGADDELFNMETRLNCIQYELENAIKENEKISLRKQELEAKKTEMKKKLGDSKQKEEECRQLEKQINEYKNKLNPDIENKIIRLEMEKSIYEERYSKLQEECEKQEKQNGEKEEYNQRKNDELNRLKRIYSEKETELKKIQRDETEWRTNLAHVETNIDIVRSSIKSCEEKIRKREEELTEIKAKFTDADEFYMKEMSELEKEVKKWKRILAGDKTEETVIGLERKKEEIEKQSIQLNELKKIGEQIRIDCDFLDQDTYAIVEEWSDKMVDEIEEKIHQYRTNLVKVIDKLSS